MNKIFITGAGGYVGAMLVRELLDKEYFVTAYDLFTYGDVFNNHKNLKIVKGDIRDQEMLKKNIPGHDILIHLACISNDPSFELNPNLGKEINYDAFEPMVRIAKDSGVERFIYASSSSVYGLKDENDVTEEAALEPLTDYSKFKAMCEDILIKYNDNNFTGTIIRPATVCGYSIRQRFDLVVNILTNNAFNKGKIIVFGGNQLRPNIHIKDMINAYFKVIEADKKIVSGQIFNAGFENKTVSELANKVKNIIGKNIEIVYEKTDDYRSYHVSSDKIYKVLSYKPNFTIDDAIKDLFEAFKNNVFTDPLNNENYFNIKKMQNINLK
jgi:nucleoside-diphosphate-sugar epimerase